MHSILCGGGRLSMLEGNRRVKALTKPSCLFEYTLLWHILPLVTPRLACLTIEFQPRIAPCLRHGCMISRVGGTGCLCGETLDVALVSEIRRIARGRLHLHPGRLLARRVLDGRLDELVGDGGGRRKAQVALLVERAGRLAQGARADAQGLLDLGDGEPARVLELRVVLEADGLVGRVAHLRDGPDHQVRGVRPRLRRVDDDARQHHAGLLPDLAAHGVLDRLGGLDEPGQGRVPVRREALLPAQQDAAGVGGEHGHDDGRVGAREREVGDGGARAARRALRRRPALRQQRRVRRRACALGAPVDRQRRVPARAAEGVARVPVQQRARLRVDGGCRRQC